MSEIRFITSSDEHLATLNPSSGFRKDDYKSAILQKLEHQGEISKKFEANAFLRGGDFFHIKSAQKNTHAMVAAAATIHRNYSCPTYAIAGNHDIVYDDLTTIPKQPLGVLYESGVFQNLTEETFISGTMKVRVIGVPYINGLSSQELCKKLSKKKDDEYVLVFVHALAAFAPEERTQSFFQEEILDYRDLVFPGCPDVYVFGHYHKDQGIKEHLGVNFVNLGAISRGALTFENLERKPKSCLIKFNSQGIDLEEYVIPHKDASEVFDLEKKKQKEQERKDLNDFIQSLEHTVKLSGNTDKNSYINSVDWNSADIAKYGQDLKNKVLQIMEEAESGGAE